MAAGRRVRLGRFAQMHATFYVATDGAEVTMLADMHKCYTGAAPKTLPLTLNATDSRLLTGNEDEFVFLHRLSDVYALRYVINEGGDARVWHQWPGDSSGEHTVETFPVFGSASLFQCETTSANFEDSELRVQLDSIIQKSEFYPRSLRPVKLAYLPFGILCELDQARPTWLLVNRSDDSGAAKWMVAHWLRLAVFHQKHAFYWSLFNRGLEQALAAAKGFVAAEPTAEASPARADGLVEAAIHELNQVRLNLMASEQGFANALLDTFADSDPSMRAPSFLHRRGEQFKQNCEFAAHHLTDRQNPILFIQRFLQSSRSLRTASKEATSVSESPPMPETSPSPDKPVKLAPCHRMAYSQYGEAEEAARKNSGRTPTDKQAYKWLKKKLQPSALPPLKCWMRYVRYGRKAHGKSKHSRRVGREHGKSAARPDQL